MQRSKWLDTFSLLVLGSDKLLSFDVDSPCICDDEYWENPDDPESAFQQPPGKPSSALYFICFIKLMYILGLVMRTIVSIIYVSAAYSLLYTAHAF